MSLSSGRGTYLGRKSPGIANSFPQHTVTYGYPILTPESEWLPSIIDKPKTDNARIRQGPGGQPLLSVRGLCRLSTQIV